MHLVLERDAPGVDASAALDWWTDFREGRADHAFLPGATRRILEQEPDGRVHIEERVQLAGLPVMRERWTGWREARAFRFAGRNTYSAFHGAYSFLPSRGGTLVRLEAEIVLRPALRWAVALARPVARAILQKDLRGHVEEMVADLREVRPDQDGQVSN